MATPFRASISSNHDSCISALIGRMLWGVPDLSDGAHVARFGWLVYILSNMSLWGTENFQEMSNCTVILFWRILAEVDTDLAFDWESSRFASSACSNKQHLWFMKIRHFEEFREQVQQKLGKSIRTRTSMHLWSAANSQQWEGMLHRTLQCQQKLQLVR